MSVSVIIDLFFGDCGKGRCSDYLMEKHDIGVRFNGGPNSGHTIFVGGKKYVTHLLPASALHPGKISVLTPGVCVDMAVLKEDITNTGLSGDPSRVLLIDPRCPVILEEHRVRDVSMTSKKIGTTGRGVGPTMEDQAARVGKRYGEVYAGATTDTSEFLYRSICRGKSVLFEGAQGHYLDLWHGTYPFVTSAPVTVGAVCTNAGIPPRLITDIYGVFKIYSTRVGEGPFPTEEFGPVSEFIREEGHEYGATTGRPRRVGWLDLPMIKKACRVNGVNWLFLTKVDILSSLSSFPVCVDRDLKGNPVYKEVRGWQTPIGHMRTYGELPDQLKELLALIERKLETPITHVSVGPERNEVVVI